MVVSSNLLQWHVGKRLGRLFKSSNKMQTVEEEEENVIKTSEICNSSKSVTSDIVCSSLVHTFRKSK